MTDKDLKTLFNDWWNNQSDAYLIQNKEDIARDAFYAAYEAGVNRGFQLGNELGIATTKLEEKMKKVG